MKKRYRGLPKTIRIKRPDNYPITISKFPHYISLSTQILRVSIEIKAATGTLKSKQPKSKLQD